MKHSMMGGMPNMNPYMLKTQNSMFGGIPHYLINMDTNPFIPGVQPRMF